MATWFAQLSGNINAANMWNSAPGGGGTVLTWPPALGDILVCNGKAVNANVNVNLGSTGQIRNDTTGGATDVGYMAPAAGVTITADLYGTASSFLIYFNATGTATIVGNMYSQGAGVVVRNNSSGTINITGNIITGSGNVGTVINISTGIINLTGDITSTGSAGYGVANNGTGTINITGNATANGSSTNAAILGNAGTIAVTGNVIQNGTGRGAYVALTGATMTVSGYVQAGTSAAGAENVQQGVLQVGETRSASNGRGAILGAFRYASTTAAKTLPIVAGTQKTLSVLDVASLVPAESDVKAGVVYGDGAYTGTLSGGSGSKKISMMRRI